MNTLTPRYRRGDHSPVNAGLVFLRYKRGKEVWVTLEKLVLVKVQSRLINARQRAKPSTKRKQKQYHRIYGRLEKRKAKQAAYYSSPEVKARLAANRLMDPERIANRDARSRWRKERAEFRASPEGRAHRIKQGRALYRKNRRRIIAQVLARRRKNPMMRLKQNISRAIRKALQSQKTRKGARTVELVGCTIPEFRAHLEKQFQLGMTWGNMGQWEIDHRVPLAAFNLADPEQQKLAFNFHNCRPLWKAANRAKSDKIEGELFKGRQFRKSNIIPFQEVA